MKQHLTRADLPLPVHRVRIARAGMLCFLGACLTVPLAWADTEFATLALEGDVAPGLATAFSGFDAPLLSDSHHAFNGYTGFSGSAINPQRTGLFVGRELTYQALLLDNDEAPGAPGTRFRLAPNGFAPSRLTQISADGSLAFTGELVGTCFRRWLAFQSARCRGAERGQRDCVLDRREAWQLSDYREQIRAAIA